MDMLTKPLTVMLFFTIANSLCNYRSGRRAVFHVIKACLPCFPLKTEKEQIRVSFKKATIHINNFTWGFLNLLLNQCCDNGIIAWTDMYREK